jgi:hypothetical protein
MKSASLLPSLPSLPSLLLLLLPAPITASSQARLASGVLWCFSTPSQRCGSRS